MLPAVLINGVWIVSHNASPAAIRNSKRIVWHLILYAVLLKQHGMLCVLIESEVSIWQAIAFCRNINHGLWRGSDQDSNIVLYEQSLVSRRLHQRRGRLICCLWSLSHYSNRLRPRRCIYNPPSHCPQHFHMRVWEKEMQARGEGREEFGGPLGESRYRGCEVWFISGFNLKGSAASIRCGHF